MRDSASDLLAPRLKLAHLPTPIERSPALDALVGTEVWVKRDDATGGAEAGNKLRKLEFLFAAAQHERADAVITCGGIQSNHARATAIVARRLGCKPVLLLRTEAAPSTREGNLLLDDLVDAELRFITREQYAQRDALMAEAAAGLVRQGLRAYVIPEGGSNGLGALGYFAAMREIRVQLDAAVGALPARFDAIVHACGSGGTAAGAVLGARSCGVADEVIAMAVCDDRAYFEARIAGIVEDARPHFRGAVLPELAPLRVLDAYKGPAYGVPSPEQLQLIRAAARSAGLLVDPVYTGKALFGLAQLEPKPRRVLFLHTGGLPGLLAEHARFAQV
jgi:D-cysteine desulfhydrase